MKSTNAFGDIDVLDAHGHFFSRKFFLGLAAQSPGLSAEADPLARIGDMTGWAMPPEGPAELGAAWRAELDANGVTAALLMSSVPGDEDSIAAAVAACPGRIAGAFMLDPTRAGAGERARRAFDELGLRVACLFPAMHHFTAAECEGARAVAALANERPGTAIFVHCGALSVGVRKKLKLPSRFDVRRGNPLDLHPLAGEFPNARFIIPHFGAGMLRETLMVADLCPNVYLDTSSSNRWTAYEPAPLDLADVFRRALAVVGHERLLFGTDSSFFPRGWHAAIFDAQVHALHEAGASEDQAAAIFGGNLRKLLQLPGVAQ
jgi:predicted TIM-barrel fold metal-dependent hydrolase